MAKEYIERDSAIFAEEAAFDGDGFSRNHAVAAIKGVPTADVRPVVRGRWLKHGYCCPCSVCGWDLGFSGTPLELKISEFNF